MVDLHEENNGSGEGEPPNGENPSRNGTDSAFRFDISRLEKLKGKRQGDAYVRIVRPDPHLLRRVAPGVLRATERVSEAHGPVGRGYHGLIKPVVGRPSRFPPGTLVGARPLQPVRVPAQGRVWIKVRVIANRPKGSIVKALPSCAVSNVSWGLRVSEAQGVPQTTRPSQ